MDQRVPPHDIEAEQAVIRKYVIRQRCSSI